MGYLICNKCKSYYKLQPGESAADFIDDCDCGGKLHYAENIDIIDPNLKQAPISDICPKCGAKNPDGATFCAECGSNMKPETNKRAAVKPPGENKKSNKKNKKSITGGKILMGGVVIFILIIGGLLISDMSRMSFEDKLIQAYESGNSTSTLTNSIESHSKNVTDYLDASYRAEKAHIEYQYSTDNIKSSERDQQLQNALQDYQSSLTNYESIKNLQDMYIKGLINKDAFKKGAHALYQQTEYLKNVEYKQ
ncbi:MAG: zinc ribbon domain-containing protein [Methanobacterium sp.]|nr:MAG: zinc ribbon domain-containing protein [Methanobacterium sp.]